ncbi:CRISPR-associated endonuclease/helicase Cas3 [Oikeobacillus pervagus]|uniref:CRISPR-associated endonuclease/helicase Cas3 n=1 Tax=Oikeobacillus pervagus TaxID=1325931 RepID=A0AAJ1WGY4_9BACI|nr:CRISPR-associated helicase Cas3' [Oikeobacillus pervagus]MDQ0215612.1 CRISPR-associated endonuclease/helicase Cas3 [Oikeobacillus pervagus]
MTTFFAKSKPDILTVREHTEDVVAAVEVLRQTYGEHLQFLTKKEWMLLHFAAKYHDVGKYSVGFQTRIKAAIQGVSASKNHENYPHNYLSVAMIPFEDLENHYELDLKDSELLSLIVGFHHERDRQPMKKEIMSIFKEQIESYIDEIEEQQSVKIIRKPDSTLLEVLENRSRIWRDNRNLSNEQKRYILLKGLLHRADYAASAKRKNEKVDTFVEQAVDCSIANQTKQYMKQKGYSIRKIQKFAGEHQDKNVLLVAQTGSGKTEAAFMWIGNEKGFFTLPLRVSLNAIYDRVVRKGEIGFTEAHLLHSGAFDYLIDDQEKSSFELTTQQMLHAQLLAGKLTFSTIDQIFKFPLLYKGFERELATLAYSKVVIDEIQAYDPHIVAILIKGIEMIHQLGGKWMIMTATLPAIFIEELEKRNLLEEKSTVKQITLLPDDRSQATEKMPRRHRIKILQSNILNCVDNILELSFDKKVLVVVNTVKRALEVYDALNGEEQSDVYLLHSQFIARDRKLLENNIKSFGQLNNDSPGIWITTQIVEASIDVDFDILFTEAATPDALFQRFGRCNRKGKRPGMFGEGFTPKEPNVFICAEEASGIDSIYEYSIVSNGLESLKNYDGELMDEETKLRIVENVFSREQLEDSEYLKTFDQSIMELNHLTPFKLDSKEAQNILRDIHSCLIIPGQELGDEARNLVELYYQMSNEEQIERKKIIQELNQLTVSVNKFSFEYRAKKERLSVSSLDQKAFLHYKIVNAKYSKNRGLELACDDVNSRFF